jgi:endonuclease-3 related protein
MPRLTDVFDRLTEALSAEGDEQVDLDSDPFERLIGVLLETSVDGVRMRSILDSLREAGLLEPEALASADPAELADVTRQGKKSLPPRSQAALQRLARWYHDRGIADGSDPISTETLREELTAINGIGSGTADELLSRGLGRPAFAVSRAAYRVLVRHGWIDASCTYTDARDLIESLAGENAALLTRLSQGFEQIGARYCRVSVAKCDRCPLRPLLPEGGPIQPDG